MSVELVKDFYIYFIMVKFNKTLNERFSDY